MHIVKPVADFKNSKMNVQVSIGAWLLSVKNDRRTILECAVDRQEWQIFENGGSEIQNRN